ncbi:uncharacterized protein LOC110185573 [Drosophila serrata]|uniref:uncharacterized protein LOC110185573 n=1 Tax=Drosophila serrata TaxID=7274 RepID=UPI000A1D3A4C|nr:uncharacterized protein LOC110185573 [Drosophila serrata]
MTTLESTAPPLVESTVLTATTVLPEITTSPPEFLCPLGFIWIVELASCMPDKSGLQLRVGFRQCIEGYYLDLRYNQCIRKKYHPKQVTGQIYKYFFETTTSRRPPTRVTTTPTPFTGPWYAYGQLGTTLPHLD